MNSPENIMMMIVNWLLGLVSLVTTITIIFGPILTIIMAIIEGTKQLAPGQKRSWKKTIIAGCISGGALLLLIGVMVVWGISNYALMTDI